MNDFSAGLPAVNATLNATSFLLLLAGYAAIRSRRVTLHRALMLSAVGTSTLFLASYLTYHALHGSRHFPGHGPVKAFYMAILLSHTVLAALVVPLVAVTLFNAARGDLARHRAVARWTLPIWLYVSITGVVVYAMLYVLYA